MLSLNNTLSLETVESRTLLSATKKPEGKYLWYKALAPSAYLNHFITSYQIRFATSFVLQDPISTLID
jgi:hypothetical protein